MPKSLDELFPVEFFTQEIQNKKKAKKEEIVENIKYFLETNNYQVKTEKSNLHIDAYIGQEFLNFNKFNNPEDNIFCFFEDAAPDFSNKFNNYTLSMQPELRDNYFSSMGHLQNIIEIATDKNKKFLKSKALHEEFNELKKSIPNYEHTHTAKTSIKYALLDLEKRLDLHHKFSSYQLKDILNLNFSDAKQDKKFKEDYEEDIRMNCLTFQQKLYDLMEIERAAYNHEKASFQASEPNKPETKQMKSNYFTTKLSQ